MPESTTTLTFKLVIDGKEAIGTVELTKTELEQLNRVTQQFSERPFLKQFAKDLVLVEASSEEATSGIMDFIKYNQLTEKEIQSVINVLREEQSMLAVGSEQWQKHALAIQNLTNATQMTVVGQQQFVQQSSAARMAVSQLGFAVGDASMIMVDFRMFLLSIGNNIPFIVQGLAKVSQEAKQAGVSFGQFLKQNMDASMKLVLGANAVMFALMVLPQVYKAIAGAAAAAEDKIKELTETMGEEEKKVRTQQMEFNALIGVMNDFNQSQKIRNEAYDQLKEKYPELIAFQKDEKDNTEKIAAALKLGNEQFEKKIKLAASERILKEYYEQAATAEYEMQKLSEQRAEMQKQFDEGNKSRGFSLVAIDNDIATLEEKKQKALKKVQEFNLAIIELNSGILDEPGDPLKLQNERIDKIIQQYQNQKQLNDLENVSNDELISKTRTIIQEELKHNLTLENRVKLKNLLKQMQDEQTVNRSAWEMKKMQEANKEFFDWFEAESKRQLKVADDRRKALEKLRELEAEHSVDIIQNQFEKERQEAANHFNEELAFYQTQYNLALLTEEEYLHAKEILEEQYTQKSMQLDREAFLYKISTYAQLVSTVTSSINQIYSAIENNAREEIATWKEKEEQKLEEERKSALKHARTQAQRERINEQFDKRRDQLEDEANKKARERLAAWFFINQVVSAANAVIASIAAGLNTMELLSKYLPPPLPQIAMGTTIAAGLAQAAVISQQKLPGYKKGGAVVGEDGIEIISPAQDFASGMSKLIIMTMMTLRDEIRAGNATHYLPAASSNGDSREVKELLTSLKRQLDNGIYARAYLDDRQAKKIRNRGSALNRRSKL